MAMGSSLLALALTAAGPAGPGDEPISCRVRVLTMDGLGWRSAYYPRLQPVARQGTSAVWTADRALAETMTGQALATTLAPMCSNPGQTTVDLKGQVHYVAHLDRVADGPINQSTAIAFQPETARVDEGIRVGVSGRKLDQGVLARVAVEETHIKAMHVVRMTESYVRTPAPPPAPNSSAREILGQFLQVVEEQTFGKAEPRVNIAIQIPEIAHSQVEGEWLIPTGGILVVSLGVETVADDQGKAAVRERVAVLEVDAAPKGQPTWTATRLGLNRPMPASPARPAMPAIPDRSIPVGVGPDGRSVETPLPEGVASADLDRIKPAPDQPSPQTTGVASLARPVPAAIDAGGPVVDLPPLPEALASADLDRIKPDPAYSRGGTPHVAAGPAVDSRMTRASFTPPAPAPRCAVGPEAGVTSVFPAYLSALIEEIAKGDKIDCDYPCDEEEDEEEVVCPMACCREARSRQAGIPTHPVPVGSKATFEFKPMVVPTAPGLYKEIKKTDGPASNP